MKKTKAFLIAAVLALSLSACGGTPNPASSGPSASQSAASSVSSQVSKPASIPAATAVSGGDYKLEIKLLGDQQAAVVIGGAVPTSEMVGTHWGVEFDKKYAVRLDVEDGFYDCFAWKFTSDTDMTRVKNMKFTIADDALILYADLSGEADFRFADVDKITLVVDDVADTQFHYDPVTVAMADVTVDAVTLTTAKIDMPSTTTGSESSSKPQEGSTPSSSSEAAPANQYVGAYTSSRGTLTVTADKITVTFDGTSYSTGYQAADIKKDGDIGKISFNSSGTEIQVFFGNDGNTVEVYVGRDGAGFARSAGTPNAPSSQAPAKSSFSAMAGSYKGGYGTLVIKTDGSFTLTNSDFNETLSGSLTAELKSGDTVQCGSYTIRFTFPDDFRAISTDIKDASGTSVGGDDMVRS